MRRGALGIWLGGGLVALQFVALAAGMLRLDLPQGAPRAWQRNFARLTGGGGSFGFFSPNVPREFDLAFEIEEHGQKRMVHLEDSLPSEVRARVTNMVNLLATHYHDDKIFRSLAASFTAAMYREHPDADSIRLFVYFNDFPSVEEFRAGGRPEPRRLYSAKFSRRRET